MDKLFIIFICVVIMAFAIIPLLTVKNIDKTDDSEQGSGKRVRSAKRKKNGDSVNAKVTPVRVVSGASGDETFDHIGIIEFDTEYGSDKSIVVDEDIDSYIVTGSLNGISVSGFDYSNSKDNVFHNCRVVKKSAVRSFYKDYTEIKYFYKNLPVQYVERDGKPTIEVYDGPVAYLKEFSVARHGGNGKDYKVYYKNIDPGDPDFRKETEHYHEDLTVDTYGLVPGMGGKEYEDILIRYLIDRITKYGSQDAVRRLVLGIYGYRFPDDGLFTDIEAVFEKVIPLRYRQLEENSVSRGNFRRDLLSAIISGYRTVGCKFGYTLVDGDRMVEPSSEYSYYICLVLHLMLMKYHKAGVRPYSELDLSNVWSKLEDGFRRYAPSENHNPVYHRDVLLCEDLGAFTIEALKKLIYFKKFDKSGDAKSVTE